MAQGQVFTCRPCRDVPRYKTEATQAQSLVALSQENRDLTKQVQSLEATVARHGQERSELEATIASKDDEVRALRQRMDVLQSELLRARVRC